MNTKILSAVLLLLLFFWFFPLVELLFFENEARTLGLALFVVSQTISIIIAFSFCLHFSFFKIKIQNENSLFRDEYFISKVTFFLACVFFLFFLTFYLSNVKSIADIFIFAERYRNNYYNGSGIYTAGMIQFLPIVISLLIAKCNKLNKYIYLCLLLLLITSFFLGLRIFLLPVFFFLMIRLMTSKKKKISFIIMIILGIFFISYKLFLTDNLSEQNLSDILLHIAGRIRYRYLIHNSNFSNEISDLLGFIAYPLMPSLDSLSDWREKFALSIPNLMSNMPFISLFSGLAFPFPIIIFNVFGVLGFVFIFPIIIVFIWAFKRLYETSSITKSVWYLYTVYFTFTILIEDIYQFSKIPLMIILMIVINLYLIFLQRKKN